MAALAVVLDALPDGRGVAEDVFVRRGTITVGTYATDGVAVSKADLQFAVSLVDLDVRPSAGYVFEWNKSTGKILAYWQSDADNGAPLIQVTDTTDLSSITPRFRAEGR